ncbi:MAG TPA: DUF1330 domain-containing protein [Stellaceae bacterium]|jgi:uncharacterized protein (DUF1330 family)|nr:DUF1330 domain-containing protein [Stellaceae bacterium]
MPDKRPAYVIAEVEITDPAGFDAYVATAIPTLAGTSGRLLTRSRPKSKEGTAPVGDVVIVAFDSLEEAERWYHGAAYGEAIPMRQRAANTRLFIVEGEPS